MEILTISMTFLSFESYHRREALLAVHLSTGRQGSLVFFPLFPPAVRQVLSLSGGPFF